MKYDFRNPMKPGIDFSRNATVYDRRHGSLLPEPVVMSLAQAASVTGASLVLDIGAGTGRVAIPLSAVVRNVLAIDIAVPMLLELRSKAGEQRVRIVAGEGQRLPCRRALFDLVVLARVLYLVADWKTVLVEAAEALAPDGRLVHEWANGDCDEPWVQIREKLRALFERAGVEQPFHPGARDEADVDSTLASLGLEKTAIVPAGPGRTLTVREFLNRIVDGELSYTWDVPKPVQDACLPTLREWCEQTFNLDEPFAMPRALQWTVYRKRMDRRGAGAEC